MSGWRPGLYISYSTTGSDCRTGNIFSRRGATQSRGAAFPRGCGNVYPVRCVSDRVRWSYSATLERCRSHCASLRSSVLYHYRGRRSGKLATNKLHSIVLGLEPTWSTQITSERVEIHNQQRQRTSDLIRHCTYPRSRGAGIFRIRPCQ